MDARLIRSLMIGITIGLIGLVTIQVLWMRNNITLKEDQFEQGVSNALFAISERLERHEKFQALEKHEAGRRLLHRLDTLRRPHPAGPLHGSPGIERHQC